ncbi:cbb3-type cytochrome oxidase assembly protein CcoS [Rubrivivax benzoatilyticus]|uniref:Cbb3-type cytochrome oxidase assembly protein CcoS n=1 Tax=Rubrivivax benzoatilyticus TaxID=316997 RepID=A0ABX0HXD7_9BURK|nr:cbb3-type cytochrome oxidase assembly protein CcoS [Rubrivivax benzoatilyticus]EGJ10721.1 cbb3-type cytochrome oxidase maturation protein [Rubrivivax benzoatilyticus JA2 = ATCC BAA-35]NHK99662.1 cbb3-type cytochrome oxidase assembly protein CcoS [Rubrivivax benzoatilyticus]NHL25535.1 cbb3-type cytochrome oxidase assembly protein CcoS [Rubrivivax benzoatilyticus]
MDILYLLIPLSAVLVLIILGVFGWALHRGQFEDLEHEGERILRDDDGPVDDRQVLTQIKPEKSSNLLPERREEKPYGS